MLWNLGRVQRFVTEMADHVEYLNVEDHFVQYGTLLVVNPNKLSLFLSTSFPFPHSPCSVSSLRSHRSHSPHAPFSSNRRQSPPIPSRTTSHSLYSSPTSSTHLSTSQVQSYLTHPISPNSFPPPPHPSRVMKPPSLRSFDTVSDS